MTATITRLDTKTADNSNEFPLANTRAARMFSKGLDDAKRNRDLSQRDIAKSLNYKSSVIVSHMASGRAPIPIERSADFARLLKLDYAEFLLAVLEQRYPNIDFMRTLVGGKLQAGKPGARPIGEEELQVLEDLQAAAGDNLGNLPTDQYAVLKEVAMDRNAKRRWVSPAELGIIDLFRSEAVDVTRNGLTLPQRRQLKEAITAL